MIPFVISPELAEFIRWCGGDVYGLDRQAAQEWADLYNEMVVQARREEQV